HEVIDVLRAMAGNIDAELTHHGGRLRPHRPGPGPGARNLVLVSEIVAEQTFRHLAARRIARTQNQDLLLVRRTYEPPEEQSRQGRRNQLRCNKSGRVSRSDASKSIGG